jgi:hypothetical protein
MYTCRECEYEINQATEICPHCGTDLTLPLPGSDGQPKKKRSTAKTLLLWGTLLAFLMGAIWSFVLYVATPHAGGGAQQAEALAVQAMDEVRALLSNYSNAQDGAYPKTLEPLGDLARQAAQMAQSEGYELQYTPGPADGSAVIRSFTLEARPGNYGYRSFYTDVSGLVRSTTENRAATSSDPPIH